MTINNRSMAITRPASNEFPPDSRPAGYIALVKHADVLDALREQPAFVLDTFRAIPAEKLHYRYAPGKWTIQEVLGHMVDVERIMVYRALCIARGEAQSLPGFEEDAYVAAAHFSERSIDSLLEEYHLQRKTNLILAANLPQASLVRMGQANNLPFSARAFLWLVAGHELHHLAVLNERYL